MDLVPKIVLGVVVGLIGFCTYLLGTAILANTVLGYGVDNFGWDASFVVVLTGCLVAIAFMVMTIRA